jgi:hypothetical protein
LQAAYNELALAETDLVAARALPPNPAFSRARESPAMAASEIERQVSRRHPAAGTLAVPLRHRPRPLSVRRNCARRCDAAAGRRRAAHVCPRIVAGNDIGGAAQPTQKATAESTAQLAVKLGETGSINKLDQAREQVFYAETTADLASARAGRQRARAKGSRA